MQRFDLVCRERKSKVSLTEHWPKCVFWIWGCGSPAAHRCSPVRPASLPVQLQRHWRSRGAGEPVHLPWWCFCAIANPFCCLHRHSGLAISSGTAYGSPPANAVQFYQPKVIQLPCRSCLLAYKLVACHALFNRTTLPLLNISSTRHHSVVLFVRSFWWNLGWNGS